LLLQNYFHCCAVYSWLLDEIIIRVDIQLFLSWQEWELVVIWKQVFVVVDIVLQAFNYGTNVIFWNFDARISFGSLKIFYIQLGVYSLSKVESQQHPIR